VTFTPTSIPLLQRVETADGERGLISIDVFEDGWQLQVGFTTDDLHPLVDCSAREGEHRSYVRRRGSVASWHKPDGPVWGRFDFGFEPRLDASTRELLINFELGDTVTSAAVAVPAATRPASARVLRAESWSSDRWSQRWQGARSRKDPEPVDHLHAVLPDEIFPLGADAGDVAGRALVFLSAERWGRTWVLRHYSARDQPVYSPLYDCDLELDCDGTEVVARHFGGGTAGLGFVYAHVFETPDLPERMVVRRPASDGGPPLVEVELCPRPTLPRHAKL
jgi:hypothetical protein